jgi:periplasmic divalent cation tolerance protein
VSACLCYVTTASQEQALLIARTLVEERLAASANVLGGATSFYWWQGTLEQASEAVVVIKTRKSLVPALTARVRQLHGYECPCVLALPVDGGNPDYLRWLERETTSS